MSEGPADWVKALVAEFRAFLELLTGYVQKLGLLVSDEFREIKSDLTWFKWELILFVVLLVAVHAAVQAVIARKGR